MSSNPIFDIAGKTALVTGSSRGIGQELARGLAASGVNVILHGRDAAALEQTADQFEKDHGRRPGVVRFDVTDAAAVAENLDALVAEHGAPDILVNNAGTQSRAPFHEFEPANFDRVIATNLSAAFYVAQQVSAAMVTRGTGGKIINIGSAMTVLARQTIAPYSASKAAVAMLSKGMAADLARYDIQVNTLSPGYFETEMNAALVADETFNDWLINRTPARRWGAVKDLVGTLLFLASPASDFVSGQNIVVDGGLTSVV